MNRVFIAVPIQTTCHKTKSKHLFYTLLVSHGDFNVFSCLFCQHIVKSSANSCKQTGHNINQLAVPLSSKKD